MASGMATLNGRELAVASLPHRPRHSLHSQPRSIPDRDICSTSIAEPTGVAAPSRCPRLGPWIWRCGISRARRPDQHTRLQPAWRTQSRRAFSSTAMRTATTLKKQWTMLARHRAMGYKAIRVQSGIPGLDATYGVPKGTLPYEPAERGLPSESRWSTEKYLLHVPKLFARVREQFGDDLHLLARLPPPPQPHRSRAPRQGTRALPPLLDGRPRPPPNSRKVSASSASTLPRR